MTRKRAKSADQTSFGTPRMTETPRALRSPPVGFRGTPPSAIVYAVLEFIWGMSVKTYLRKVVGQADVVARLASLVE